MSWQNEFDEKFGHIGNIGVQCDKITLMNLKEFIQKLLDSSKMAWRHFDDNYKPDTLVLSEETTNRVFILKTDHQKEIQRFKVELLLWIQNNKDFDAYDNVAVDSLERFINSWEADNG